MVSSITDVESSSARQSRTRFRASLKGVCDEVTDRVSQRSGSLSTAFTHTDNRGRTDEGIASETEPERHSESTGPASGRDGDEAGDDGREVPDEETLAGQNDLPLDVTFDLLKNERRRHVLRHMVAADGHCTLGGLAEHVAAIENEKPESLLSSDERKRVYIALYQCHLPKLDDANVLDFDDDRGTIEPGDNLESVIGFLERSEVDGDEASDPVGNWSSYYLATALVGSTGFGLSIGVGVDHMLSAAVPTVALLVTAGIALVHRTTNDR